MNTANPHTTQKTSSHDDLTHTSFEFEFDFAMCHGPYCLYWQR
jgi:hypothetical protein